MTNLSHIAHDVVAERGVNLGGGEDPSDGLAARRALARDLAEGETLRAADMAHLGGGLQQRADAAGAAEHMLGVETAAQHCHAADAVEQRHDGASRPTAGVIA